MGNTSMFNSNSADPIIQLGCTVVKVFALRAARAFLDGDLERVDEIGNEIAVACPGIDMDEFATEVLTQQCNLIRERRGKLG